MLSMPSLVREGKSAVGLRSDVCVAGFSFSGEVREPFPSVIQALQDTKLPVTSVDAPSSWDIENGPPKSGLGSSFMPTALISLTAPKPLVKHFEGRHFVGGRYAGASRKRVSERARD
jgi:NAD(P)H-hydrate epimerase